ncbi:MAG: hypothetical protein ACE5K8_05970 [Candidatus Zixiibacteriota bacterium]
MNLSSLSPGHVKAAKLYHSDFIYLSHLSPSEMCLICHSTDRATVVNDTFFASMFSQEAYVPTVDPHGSHPIGQIVRPGSSELGDRMRMDIDSRLLLPGGRIECITCHSLSTTNDFRADGFVTQNELCRACHDID